MNELVSIITPSYNSSTYISETIESIISQTYTNWELLITDDCSADDSVKLISQYVELDSRIRLFKLLDNSGAAVARNNSIKEAKGRFIAFCDSDDIWLPDKLEKQISFMSLNGYAFTYSSYYSRKENEDKKKLISFPNKLSYFSFLKDCIGCLTAIYDTHLLGKQYMPLLRKRQDWALWLILVKKSRYAYGIEQPLAIYRIRKDAISANKLGLIKHNLRVYQEVLGFSKIKSYFVFSFLYMPSYINKKLSFKFSKYIIE